MNCENLVSFNYRKSLRNEEIFGRYLESYQLHNSEKNQRHCIISIVNLTEDKNSAVKVTIGNRAFSFDVTSNNSKHRKC